MKTKPTLIVVAALLTRGGTILINQRPAGTGHAGRWEFPGGKVEPGEDPRAALARECHEELGCHVTVGAVYETIFAEAAKAYLLLLFYTARIDRGEPAPMEGNTLAWVTPAELAQYDLLEPDRPLIPLLEQRFPHYLNGA